MLFTAEGNVRRVAWSARAPTAHAVIRSCRKIEKHCSRRTKEDRDKSRKSTHQSFRKYEIGVLLSRPIRITTLVQLHSLYKVVKVIPELN
jgi:hypothetical protein